MNREQQQLFNSSLKEMGSGTAARTASLAADAVLTCMGSSYDRLSTTSNNDLVMSTHAHENYPEDDDFRLSTDLDALFFASGSGSSNDGGSDKASLNGDEDENTLMVKSVQIEHHAVPTWAPSTHSTGNSTSVLPTPRQNHNSRHQKEERQKVVPTTNVPQHVGPATTIGQAKNNQAVHPIPFNQQHLIPLRHTTGIAPVVQSSSVVNGVSHNMLASKPWITIGPIIPPPNSSNQGIDNVISSTVVLPSTIHLSAAKLSSSQNPSSSSSKTTKKRGRNSSSASHDCIPPMETFIPHSTGSSTCSLDQNFIPENEHESKSRRKDRNFREQMRSQKITHQIADLKDLLVSSNVPCKPDKFSTLTSVYQYIKDLHEKKVQLDEELRYLVQTINQSNNAVHASQGLGSHHRNTGLSNSSSTSMEPYVVTSSSSPNTTTTCNHHGSGLSPEETVDYQSVFTNANVPLAVIRLDGKMIDCNVAFTTLFSVTRVDLGLPLSSQSTGHGNSSNDSTMKNKASSTATTVTATTRAPMSLFHVLAPYNMNPLFVAMSSMLEKAAKQFQTSTSLTPASASTVVTNDSSSDGTVFEVSSDYWSGVLYPHEPSKIPLQINITVERNHEHYPKFFNCSLFRMDGLSSS